MLMDFAQRDAAAREPVQDLTAELILAWADEFRARTGSWPGKHAGEIPGTNGETWLAVEAALSFGLRGLAGRDTLARLLARERGRRNRMDLPNLSPSQILTWADDHCRATGRWPNHDSGEIVGVPGEKWSAVVAAMEQGARGLPAGSSLAQLLAEHRGVRNEKRLPNLSVRQILKWADAYHRKTKSWPSKDSGPIDDAAGESWKAVSMALIQCGRGIRARTTLARLLAKHRGVRNPMGLPALTEDQIVEWADAHHSATGTWPLRTSGPIRATRGETWLGISQALVAGRRGLAGGSSLSRLLADRRGVRNIMALPLLKTEQVLVWADEHHRQTGRWPTQYSGPVIGAPGEVWGNVNAALTVGRRGLPGRSSLAKLLAEHRGARNHLALPHLEAAKIVSWARVHFKRTGKRPTIGSGDVVEAPGEKWSAIDTALRQGTRGLQGGSSLTQLLDEHFGGERGQ